MPVMDGLEATKRIRKLEEQFQPGPTAVEQITPQHRSRCGRKLLIIGMSANSDHDTTVLAFESGVDTFMAKPFTVETFKSTIEMLLKQPRVVMDNAISVSLSIDAQ